MNDLNERIMDIEASVARLHDLASILATACEDVCSGDIITSYSPLFHAGGAANILADELERLYGDISLLSADMRQVLKEEEAA